MWLRRFRVGEEHQRSHPQEEALPKVRVFVSSPSDVMDARAKAEQVIIRLDDAPPFRDRLSIKAWMHEASTVPQAGPTAQDVVHAFMGRSGQCEVFVLIIGNRLGTPLQVDGAEYPSGTVYEFDQAYRSFLRRGSPVILTYQHRRAGDDADDSAQAQGVRQFLASFGGAKARYQGFIPRKFSDTEQFEKMLQADLERVLYKRLESARRRASRWPVWAAVGLSLLVASSALGYVFTDCSRRAHQIISAALVQGKDGAGPKIWQQARTRLEELGPCATDEVLQFLGREELRRADRDAAPLMVGALNTLADRGARGEVCGGFLSILKLPGTVKLERPNAGYTEPVQRAVLNSLRNLECAGAPQVACELLSRPAELLANTVDPPDDLGPVLQAARALADRSCRAALDGEP
jgi:hypothetical protein